MNRKLCLLCLSRTAPETQGLLESLSTPHDFLSMAGVTAVFIDTPQEKDLFVKEFAINELPALIICYRGQQPQAFIGVELIQQWFHLLFAEIINKLST